MFCANCSEKIVSDPVKYASDYFCSPQCANLAGGFDSEDEFVYFEEDDMTEDLFEDLDE